MVATIAARSKNDGYPTGWDGIVMGVEAPCETFDLLNACEAAYDGVNQNQHQNYGVSLLAGQDLTWDCSVPWPDMPYFRSLSGASNLSPRSILSGPHPDWQSYQPDLAPQWPHSLDQAFLYGESDELWQNAQWPRWPPQKGNQKRFGDADLGQLIWPAVPDFNTDQLYFDDLAYLNYTGKPISST